ncbi:hypothetical protein Nepgr_009688 [Nepenthes gracilis]|uniref:Uncharacterized protein n=1 Tax=Nepenthes gracilis TaxID=150966 RepID=A0AAD3SAZ3_NEPGR|nr:hypothetical protein Nepgr_009688 [Nepenthes gracilis]
MMFYCLGSFGVFYHNCKIYPKPLELANNLTLVKKKVLKLEASFKQGHCDWIKRGPLSLAILCMSIFFCYLIHTRKIVVFAKENDDVNADNHSTIVTEDKIFATSYILPSVVRLTNMAAADRERSNIKSAAFTHG